MHRCSSLCQHAFTKPLQIENVSTGLAPFSMQSAFSYDTPHGGHVKNVRPVSVSNKYFISPHFRYYVRLKQQGFRTNKTDATE